MSLVTTNTDKVEITGLTKDNSVHVVDLSAFVQEGCLAILLQFVNNHASTSKAASYHSVGSFIPREMTLAAKSHQIFIARLDDSYQLVLKLEDSNVDAFIHAEFFEGIVLRQTDNWISLSNDPTGWKTHTITPLGDDSYADIEAVLIHGYKGSGTAPFGARPLGSTEETASLIAAQILTIPVKTNANGQYQIYIPSGCGPPEENGIEIGYIKQNYNFTALTEPANLTPDTNADWGALSLSGSISDYSTHAVVRLVQSAASGAGTDTCGIRGIGSTNVADVLSVGKWANYWAAVDEDINLEYRYNGTKEVLFSVWGYISIEPPPEPEPPEPPPEPEDLELSTIKRAVVSLGPVLLEVFNLENVTDGDTITTQIQHPEFGFGVVTTDGSSVSSAVNLVISGRTVTINNEDLADDTLILMIFGY